MPWPEASAVTALRVDAWLHTVCGCWYGPRFTSHVWRLHLHCRSLIFGICTPDFIYIYIQTNVAWMEELSSCWQDRRRNDDDTCIWTETQQRAYCIQTSGSTNYMQYISRLNVVKCHYKRYYKAKPSGGGGRPRWLSTDKQSVEEWLLALQTLVSICCLETNCKCYGQ